MFLLFDTSGKSPSPPPVADTSIVAQPSTLPEAAQGTILEAAKDATELMAADLNKEKAAPTGMPWLPPPSLPLGQIT